MTDGETYFVIVWKQFRKNRFAYWSLWLLVPIVLIAIFAPAIASNRPFYFQKDGEVSFPWFRALFHSEQEVDFIFNMTLLAFFPSVIFAVLLNWRLKRKNYHGPARAASAAFCLAVVSILLIAFATLPQRLGLESLIPSAQQLQSDYLEQQFHAGEHSIRAAYPLMPFDPVVSDVTIRNQPPLFQKEAASRARALDDCRHWLGTETGGRDVLVQLIYGTRLALTIGVLAVAMYVSIGVILGSVGGYFGGWVDVVISRVVEVVLLFPSFFLILTLVGLIGPSIYVIMGVIGLTNWPSIARLTRGEVLKQRSLDYTTAAQAMGVSHIRIIFRHILPNALGPALVSIPFGISSAIITEAGLSLLGFGIKPPAPSWGTLLNLGKQDYTNWWLVVFPALAMFYTITIFNLIGSGLRDAMDPRLRI